MAAISVISSIARSIVRTRRQQAEFAPLVALLGLGCGTGVVDVAPLGGVALSRRTGVPVSMNKKKPNTTRINFRPSFAVTRNTRFRITSASSNRSLDFGPRRFHSLAN